MYSYIQAVESIFGMLMNGTSQFFPTYSIGSQGGFIHATSSNFALHTLEQLQSVKFSKGLNVLGEQFFFINIPRKWVFRLNILPFGCLLSLISTLKRHKTMNAWSFTSSFYTKLLPYWTHWKPPLCVESRQHTRLHPPLLRVRQLLQVTRQVW